MRIMVLGASGMLGHQLVRQLCARHRVLGVLRRELGSYAAHGLFTPDNAAGGVDIRRPETLVPVMDSFGPEVVVNAAGLVKQRPDASDTLACLEANAVFPHRLARLCQQAKARLIHFSTDCVFSGGSGPIPDDAPHDARDVYGRTKSLGEVTGPGCLTLRTSMIGLEIENRRGLVEWFLAQRGVVRGYTRAFFSGLTTLELSRVVEMLLDAPGELHGAYNLSAAPISKHALLARLGELAGHPAILVEDDSLAVDRSLDSSRFQRDFGYAPPSWEEMLLELAQQIRTHHHVL
ncbi:dTDP-4-dehydrorhamnose reductase family protein [Fundidesulfovibrio putealis]|uniref:dTDP-4-dehydrorhamnose reductase family protein n=1 Tax=Fundidesulfovibrio putealis TaxID=270496 RepID=UPI0004235D8E|nr:SDR family oxidoreductase [Fundidesulfovibrio putealis]